VESSDGESGGQGSKKTTIQLPSEINLIDPALMNTYLELQIQWLRHQLSELERSADLATETQAGEASARRWWKAALPTTVMVLIGAAVAGVLVAVNWDALISGITSHMTPDITSSTTPTHRQAFNPADLQRLGTVVAEAANQLRDWSGLLLSILGGSALIALRRLLFRSSSAAVVPVLSVLTVASLVCALVIADGRFVNMHFSLVAGTQDERPATVWQAWGAAAFAFVLASFLLLELADLARQASATSDGDEAAGVVASVRRFFTSNWIGRFLFWLTTPRSWKRWVASVAILLATSTAVVVSAALIDGRTNHSQETLWIAVALVFAPLGPAWWLWLVGVVVATRSGRKPVTSSLTMFIFTATPIAALALIVLWLWSGETYAEVLNLSSPPYMQLLLLISLITLMTWLIWAGVVVPACVRIAYAPALVALGVSIFIHAWLLPALVLAAILAVGLPSALWEDRASIAVEEAAVSAVPVEPEETKSRPKTGPSVQGAWLPRLAGACLILTIAISLAIGSSYRPPISPHRLVLPASAIPSGYSTVVDEFITSQNGLKGWERQYSSDTEDFYYIETVLYVLPSGADPAGRLKATGCDVSFVDTTADSTSVPGQEGPTSSQCTYRLANQSADWVEELYVYRGALIEIAIEVHNVLDDAAAQEAHNLAIAQAGFIDGTLMRGS
jgi:hypothetical protein